MSEVKEFICIICPRGCHLRVDPDNDYEVTGNACIRGEKYGKQEAKESLRTVTSTVVIHGSTEIRLPVKTSKAVPKVKINDVISEVMKLEVNAPVALGDVLIENVADTGADLVATRSLGIA